jgi:cell fate regulator YaaT (PSP1 superfamily)
MDMTEVIGVRFKGAGKVYYFDPAGIELKVDDPVVVQTTRGIELGRVATLPKQVPVSEMTQPLKPVLRKAEAEDLEQAEENRAKEQAALERCTQLAAKHRLPLKLLSAEYGLDGSRLTFFFSSEGRVDFRELVRELAAIFNAAASADAGAPCVAPAT